MVNYGDPVGEGVEEGAGLIEVRELFWGGGEAVVHAFDGEVGYGDAGFAEATGVGVTLVAEDVVLGGDDEGWREMAEVGSEEGDGE